MEEFLSFIETNRDVINVLSSVISVVVIFTTLVFTIIYVKATIKLVHIPYKCYLKPVDLKPNTNINVQDMKICNFGPGTAINTMVKYCMVKRICMETNKNKTYEYLKLNKSRDFIEIGNNQEGRLTLDFTLMIEKPFVLEWISITGKKYKKYFKYNGGTKNIFAEVDIFGIWKYELFKLFLFLKQPYILMKKQRYLEISYISDKILYILEEKGPLELYYISDEFEKRTDKEIKKVLKSLIRKKFVVKQQGFKYSISKKGILKINSITTKL